MAYNSYGYGNSTTALDIAPNNNDGLKFILNIDGDFPLDYDVYDSNNLPTMSLDASKFVTLEVTNTWTKYIELHRVTLWAHVGMGAEYHFIAWNNYWNDGYVKVGRGSSMVVLGRGSKSFTEGQYIKVNEDVKQDLTLPYAIQNIKFFVEVKYRKKGGDIKTTYCYVNHQPNMDIYPKTVHNKSLVSINPYNQKTEFFKHELFSLGNGEVKVTYKYVVHGSTVEEKLLSNFSSVPKIGQEVTDQTEATLSFRNVSVSYPITIQGVDRKTTFENLPKFPPYIKLGQYAPDLIGKTTITYSDNSTIQSPTNVSALVTPGFIGYFSVAYNAYSSKTKEYIHWGEKDGVEIDPYIEAE